MDIQFGYLAERVGIQLPLLVLNSDAGFYIGTWQNGPYSRESIEYFTTQQEAQEALSKGYWTQRTHP